MFIYTVQLSLGVFCGKQYHPAIWKCSGIYIIYDDRGNISVSLPADCNNA